MDREDCEADCRFGISLIRVEKPLWQLFTFQFDFMSFWFSGWNRGLAFAHGQAVDVPKKRTWEKLKIKKNRSRTATSWKRSCLTSQALTKMLGSQCKSENVGRTGEDCDKLAFSIVTHATVGYGSHYAAVIHCARTMSLSSCRALPPSTLSTVFCVFEHCKSM